MRQVAATVAIAFAVAGCSAGAPAVTPPPVATAPLSRQGVTPSRASKITHIVLLVQENRSFDNFFATFPGADGATSGKMHNGKTIPLKKHNLSSLDISHDSQTFQTDYDGGKMDGFDQSLFIHSTQKAGTYPYQYVNPTQIQPYWTMAQQYALLDHMFQTQGSGSFTAHQDLIAGATAIDAKDSIIDTPSGSPWGCDAPAGTRTSLITTKGVILRGKGPFPCWTYPTGTLRDVLDAKGVSWRYYVPPYKANTPGGDWNAFAAIDAVRHGPEWQNNISIPESNILNDIPNHKLAAVSWVIPDQFNSDHPADNHRPFTGPAWIASIVNAIGQSEYWNSTAIIVVWDDWGGFYDHEPPAFFDDAGGLGFRVPCIVISPYIHAGTISHTQFEFGSILRFVENTFGLASMGTTDARAKSIGVIFHFNQNPRPFTPIPSDRSREFFLHQQPSYLPVDTE
jgi:phospholipase C